MLRTGCRRRASTCSPRPPTSSMPWSEKKSRAGPRSSRTTTSSRATDRQRRPGGDYNMAHSREDVLTAVRASFPKESQTRVLELLDTYGLAAHERERERVQIAMLKLSEGSEEKLREYVDVVKRDYRDVLFWAEYPEEAKVDTPEKRLKVRELFEKLGLG